MLTLAQEIAITDGIDAAVDACFSASRERGWWINPENGKNDDFNNGLFRATKLCLIHSEISEAMEGERKGIMDDKLPHRPMAEVELADALIRIFDYAGACGYDLAGALIEKMAYNAKRADHQPAHRAKAGGKKW